MERAAATRPELVRLVTGRYPNRPAVIRIGAAAGIAEGDIVIVVAVVAGIGRITLRAAPEGVGDSGGGRCRGRSAARHLEPKCGMRRQDICWNSSWSLRPD